MVMFACWRAPFCNAATWGVARSATPVLNTPDFSGVFGGKDGRTMKSDRCGQVRELEFIALPGTAFRVLGKTRTGAAAIYRVETTDYPAPPGAALYVDSRFIEQSDASPPPRRRDLPEPAQIIAALKAAVGSPYVWGGNVSEGIPEMARMFYHGTIPEKDMTRMTMAGLDCSGLLYQATGGWTPRNTSQLIAFGRGISVAGKTAGELARLLEPLDLIVWNGHVIIVLDRQTVIESRLECGRGGNGGVKTTPLRRRLAEIMQTRRPADVWPSEQRTVFVIRRWLEH
jgi:hypothetical protein